MDNAMTKTKLAADYRAIAQTNLDTALQHILSAGAVMPNLEHHPGTVALTRQTLGILYEYDLTRWKIATDGARTLRLHPGLLGDGHAVVLLELFHINTLLAVAHCVRRTVGDQHDRLTSALDATQHVMEAQRYLDRAEHTAEVAQRTAADPAEDAPVFARMTDIASRFRPMERCAARALYHAIRLLLLDARSKRAPTPHTQENSPC